MEKLRMATYIVDALVEEEFIYYKSENEAWKTAMYAVCYKDEIIAFPERAMEDIEEMAIPYLKVGKDVYVAADECAEGFDFLLDYLDEMEEKGEKMKKLDIVIRVMDALEGDGLIYEEDGGFFEAFAIAIKAVFKEDETIALPKCAKETLNRLGIVYQEESEKVHIRAWECADNIESLYEYI